jgi:hypothetical protein
MGTKDKAGTAKLSALPKRHNIDALAFAERFAICDPKSRLVSS